MSGFARFLKQRIALSGAAALVGITIAGGGVHYSQRVLAADEQAPSVVAAPQDVEIVVMRPVKVRLWNEFSGRLEAVDRVDVKPRVGGTITEVLFTEGTLVKKGDPLFTIDERPFQAALDRTRAALQEAKAEVSLTRSELRRAKRLIANNSISESGFDTADSAYQVALAKAAAAEAELTKAELNYDYAHIRAPISGRIDRAELTVGNVVEAGANAPILTSIVSTEKLYATFDVDERTYLDNVRNQGNDKMPVELRLSGDGDTTYHGVVHAFANELNTTSGTIRARALLDNRDGALLPGMFATIRLGLNTLRAALLISDKAIGTNQDQKYVYVVTPDNEVAYRVVTLGRSVGGQRLVLSGLQAGDKVLVNSLQRVRPGAKVAPVDIALRKTASDDVNS